MQANRSWTPPIGPLGRLSAAAAVRAEALMSQRAELQHRAANSAGRGGFAAALRRADVAVIAEVKRRSPSKGPINPSVDASAQAEAYAAGGAAALSILTEPHEFGGSVNDLAAAHRATTLPTLKKDFHVHPIQMLEARAAGASAVLLIARALPPGALRMMADEAGRLGLEILVEVRSEEELEDALVIDDAVIGVNSRDLETLVIEPAVTARLIARIPLGRLAIAESGVSGRADVERVAAIGADAVLVGSSISAAADPVAAVAALTGVTRRRRAS